MMKMKSIVATAISLLLITACTSTHPASDSLSSVSASSDHVAVKNINLSLPGYLVIHQIDNNQPGKIIGLSKLYPLGKSNDITIATIEKLVPGTEYLLVIHHDNSDLKFIASQDLPAKNGQGQIIMTRFTPNK